MRSTAVVIAVALVACSREYPASELGAELFSDPTVSTSPYNTFSCATCHQVGADPGSAEARIDPGYDLANVIHRGSWWGGYETRLLDAMNVCVKEFMGGRRLTAEDLDAQALFEYLEEHSSAADARPLAMTVVKDATGLSRLEGDAVRGADVYARACHRCHGAPHTGEGRSTERATVVPEDTAAAFPSNTRAAVVEKIRHGKFFGIGGIMPLYSAETLSDQEIADMLAYLGL